MKAIKKATDINSILGVMNLFNNEEYYKYAIEVLWTLREVALNEAKIDYGPGHCMSYDKKHPNFWIAEVTNGIIGRSLIKGYNYVTIGVGHWYIGEPRDSNLGFLTYDEASFISGIVNDEKLMGELYRLRALVSCYADDKSHPAYNIYRVSSDLIEALTGHKMLLGDACYEEELASAII